MTKKLSVILFLTGILVSYMSAANIDFSVFAGINEFKTYSQVGTRNDLYENHLGHYYFDESGNSFQAGIQMRIAGHIGLQLQYRTPRMGTSYFFSSKYPMYLSVINGGNEIYLTLVRSYLSSISTEIRYYLMPDKDLSPYLGLGIELAIMNVDEHHPTSWIPLYNFRLIPDEYFTDLGTKLLGGLILPAGMMVNLSDHVSIDLGLNYTFMHIKQWDAAGDIPVEQDMGGLYLLVGVLIVI
ncbi:MAG: outer membrane beta-barrel protein [Candidatus Marinimicrobia bacterium]|nr:outer membrane beta-barrel protein [Candidatus Neomarinimicrobiota bacterium]